MVQIHHHSSITEFEIFNDAYFVENYYATAALNGIFSYLADNPDQLKLSFSITGQKDQIILVLWVNTRPELLLLYGTAWDDEMLTRLSELISIDQNTRYQLSGQTQLIKAFLAHKKQRFETITEKLIYKCTQENEIENKATGRMMLAEMGDINPIAIMSEEFRIEEYGDRAPDTDMRAKVVIPGIYNKSIYKWVDGKTIRVIAQVNTENDSPIIGLFYTAKDSRKKGYGTALLHSLTTKLLKEYVDVGLQAMANNNTSNAVFKRVGYEEFYQWIKVITL